jgi:hypothetical protein
MSHAETGGRLVGTFGPGRPLLVRFLGPDRVVLATTAGVAVFRAGDASLEAVWSPGAVVTGLAVRGDGLVTAALTGRGWVLRRIDGSGAVTREIPLPFAGPVVVDAGPDGTDVALGTDGWAAYGADGALIRHGGGFTHPRLPRAVAVAGGYVATGRESGFREGDGGPWESPNTDAEANLVWRLSSDDRPARYPRNAPHPTRLPDGRLGMRDRLTVWTIEPDGQAPALTGETAVAARVGMQSGDDENNFDRHGDRVARLRFGFLEIGPVGGAPSARRAVGDAVVDGAVDRDGTVAVAALGAGGVARVDLTTGAVSLLTPGLGLPLDTHARSVACDGVAGRIGACVSASADATLLCLDAASGEVVEQRELDGSKFGASVVAADGAFVASYGKKLAAVVFPHGGGKSPGKAAGRALEPATGGRLLVGVTDNFGRHLDQLTVVQLSEKKPKVLHSGPTDPCLYAALSPSGARWAFAPGATGMARDRRHGVVVLQDVPDGARVEVAIPDVVPRQYTNEPAPCALAWRDDALLLVATPHTLRGVAADGSVVFTEGYYGLPRGLRCAGGRAWVWTRDGRLLAFDVG